jgi:hypothetical protein
MRRAWLLSTAILLPLAAGSPVRACSVVEHAPDPTNYERVREAPVIVLAKSVAAERDADAERNPWGSTVRFEVEEVLKGDFRPTVLSLPGHLGFAGRGPEDDFSRARPGAYAGSCLAYDYRLQHHYLLFLEKSELDDRWTVAGPAFSRANEEVDVPDLPWLTTVRLYLRVAALGDYDKEKAALRELRAKAAAGTAPKAFPKGLIGDVDLHFATPSVAKSPADLIDLYTRAESDAARRRALWGLAETAPPAARDLLRSLILKETRPERLTPLAMYFSKVADHEILGPLAQTWDRLPPDSWSRQALLWAIVKAASPQDAPLMTGLLQKVSPSDSATTLAQWFTAPGIDPRIALDVLHHRLDDTPGDFTRFQEALALLGDPDVVSWAEPRIWKDLKTEDGWKTARVLAFSPLPTADAAVRKVIESGGETRVQWLLQALTDPFFANVNPRRWDRLDDLLRTHSTDAAFLAKLKTDFFYLRRDTTGEDQAQASRLFDRTREALAALPGRKP